MTINSSTGLISWTPEESQVGEHEVSVKVSDGWRKGTQDFSIEVGLKKLSSIPLACHLQPQVFPNRLVL